MTSTRIEDLCARYDAFFLDAYGVLVDGSGAMDGARELLAALRAAERPFFVVSNDASRLPSTSAARFLRLGLPIKEEQIVSSGSLLTPWADGAAATGKTAFVLGTADAARFAKEAGLVVLGAESLAGDAAEVTVVADDGGFDFLPTVEAVFSSICRRVESDQPVSLVLPNPDLIYPKSTAAFGFTAGAIAKMIEDGLQTRYGNAAPRFVPLGKPYAPIFDEAVRRAGTSNALMVGDQLVTDIEGAANFGLDSLLVGTLESAGPVQPTHRVRALRKLF